MKLPDKPRAHILLIDDELPICIGVSGLLQIMGFIAEYALDADEGMQYLNLHPETDVVLLDINLGAGKNGIELLSEIRERFKYIQVMMFTSHDSLNTGLECMKKGAADYLTKPFNEKEFLEKVPEVLAKKNMARLNELYFGILIHDLKNPLQCISGAWELAKLYLSKTLSGSQQRVLQTGDAGLVHMKAMIDNMLSVSKFEAGSFPVSKAEFNVRREAEIVLLPLRLQVVSCGKLFEAIYKESPEYSIISDKDLFSRVLFNIVSNAIRYTQSEGSISVVFEKNKSGDLQTSICNIGSYVEENLREKIFDKFSSIHLMKQQTGTSNYGLGLTFSKMAVEAMEGKIWVESENKTPSTTFFFTIKNHSGGGI
jgi:two-component system sensor histidine kinase/response regulator